MSKYVAPKFIRKNILHQISAVEIYLQDLKPIVEYCHKVN